MNLHFSNSILPLKGVIVNPLMEFDIKYKVVNNNGMIKERLKQAREAAGLTQTELANAASTSQTSIYKIESGITIRPRGIERIAKILKVSPEWLQFGAGEESNVTNAPPIRKMIPVISWIQAGEFCENNVVELHEVEEWLPCPANASDRAFGLRVKGDSMTSPNGGDRSYPEGIVIYVDPEVEVRSGKRVIAKSIVSHEATFKTYIEDNGVKYLIPINPQFPTVPITKDVHICGVIIGSYWPE